MVVADQSYCEVQMDGEGNYCREFHKEQDAVRNSATPNESYAIPLVKNHHLCLCQLSRNWVTEC